MHGLSSLGLHEVDGGLALTALPMSRPPSFWEERFMGLKVFGFVTRGRPTRATALRPETWSPAAWDIDDPLADAPVDPQGFEGGFWYYAARGREGDPAKRDGAHEIRSSPPPLARIAAPGLADPMPVRFGGQLHLFATVWLGEGQSAVAHYAGDPLVEIGRASGLSVPFAAVVEDGLWLMSQAVVNGRRQPVWMRSVDGRIFHDPVPVDIGPLSSCTSPVFGRLVDGWLLLCVEERGGPR